MCFEAFLEHLPQAEADTGVLAWRLGAWVVVPADHRRVDASIYGHMLLHAHVSSEQKALRTLVHATAQTGSCGSLLVWHTSSREARAQEHLERFLLHAAAARGLVQVCAWLLAEGFDVDLLCGREGMTPSHVAAAHGEVDVLAFLLGHHANANEMDDNWTPLALVLRVLSKPTSCILAWNNDFHFKVRSLLLKAQAGVGMNCHAHPFSKCVSQGASDEIQNLLSLHSQFQCLGRRCHFHELSLSLFCGFQFVTAVFVVSAKSRMCADEQRSVESWRKRTSTRWDSHHATKRSPSAGHDHKQIALIAKSIRGSGSSSAVF